MATRGGTGWQSEKTVLECNRYMLDNEISTDVCFVVGPPDGDIFTFHAHKCFLISRSEVFEAMFSSGMIECRSDPEAKVRVEDIDADIFKEVLNHIYCENASMCPESAAHLMYAAKKYMLPKLVRECCKCLSDSLSPNNVINILEHILRLDEQQLVNDCLKLISLSAKAVLTGAEILSASRQAMEAILGAKTMSVRESVIYETTVNWAKHQLQSTTPGEYPTDLQIREALGDLLYKIRFPIMKPTEFVDITEDRDVLTAEEKAGIYYFLFTKKVGCELKFSTEPRMGEEVWIDRTLKCARKHWLSICIDAINFKTDHDILLTGIGLFPGNTEKGYDVDVEILQSDNSMFKKNFALPCSRDSTPFKIELDEPIVVPAGVLYSIKALARQSVGYYGELCQAVCTKEAVTFTFSKHTGSPSTNEKIGQIPRLYFCSL